MFKIKENTEYKKIIKEGNTSKLISSKLTEDLELEESSEILSCSSFSLEFSLKKKGYRIFHHNDEILGFKNKDLEFFKKELLRFKLPIYMNSAPDIYIGALCYDVKTCSYLIFNGSSWVVF